MKSGHSGAVSGVAGGSDVEKDLAGARRTASHCGQDADCIVCRSHTPQQVHDGYDSEDDHAGALEKAQRARLLTDEDLQIKGAGEHPEQAY